MKSRKSIWKIHMKSGGSYWTYLYQDIYIYVVSLGHSALVLDSHQIILLVKYLISVGLEWLIQSRMSPCI